MTFAPVALVNFTVSDRARGLKKYFSGQQALHVLVRHRQTLASDPRDKIFAFSGLVNTHLTGISVVRPGYDVPVAELYMRFAVETMRNEASLRVLSVPHVKQFSSVGRRAILGARLERLQSRRDT